MKYLNALNKISGVGPKKLQRLLSFFGSGENIWQASLSDLEKSGIGPALAEKINHERINLNPQTEWEILEKESIEVIDKNHPHYPLLLKETANPPFLLYIRRKNCSWNPNSAPMIAIIGSRKYTAYGSQVAAMFAHDLAQAGFTIVSGMALGIDGIAHENALLSGGQTIAILGSSLDNNHIYPRAHFNLSQRIMENGALISDYPCPTQASQLTFPARNRLIAGMSLATLVVEANAQSGTLITANFALEENREVLAVPGSIFSEQSQGTHELIKKGAALVRNVGDVLEVMNFSQDKTIPKTVYVPETSEETLLLKFLSREPIHIDNLIKLSTLGTASALSTLAMMEMKGWVKNIGGQRYVLI